MSSSTTLSFDIPFSYNFVLKWTLNVKELKDLKDNQNACVLRSNLYNFKPVEDLRFYLEIKTEQSYYQMKIKGLKTWSFKLKYAFIVHKSRAYSLKGSDKISFLNFCTTSDAWDEGDAVHCLVNACPVHSAASKEEDDVFLQKEENTIDIGGIPNCSLPSKYTNEMVIDFIRRGDIPCFTVNEAIEVIAESVQHQFEVLKILCMEYLMKEITAENLKQILEAAIRYNLPDLERACTSKIVNGGFQITKVESQRVQYYRRW